jgi:hypothetical protein
MNINHIRRKVEFMQNSRLEKAQGRFTDNENDIDMTRLESGMAFLQVKP